MKHIPVLKNEILSCFDYLKDIQDVFFVDGTLGAGGHSIAIANALETVNIKFNILGIDKDKNALELAADNLRKVELYDDFILVHDDFKNIKEILDSILPHPASPYKGEGHIDGALLDLGVSSMQLDQKDRGFSFTNLEAKLDMRMDQSQKLDAISVLNHYPEEKLEKILREYGEEKFSRGISKNICIMRRNKHVETVGDLVYVLEKSIPIKIQKTSRVHFATKTFQAIRIEVNGELRDLKESLVNFVDSLRPGARLAVVTFHSLEDRIVKNTFRDLASDCSCPENAPICNCNKVAQVSLINKKPIIAEDEEIAINPRSRSAKLRIVEKLF